MKTTVTLDFMWIPPDFGGHRFGPWEGMRLQIRWQKYLEEYLQNARSVQCNILHYDALTLKGKALCIFPFPDPVPSEWLQDGELVELLGGFNVLAIGKITAGNVQNG